MTCERDKQSAEIERLKAELKTMTAMWTGLRHKLDEVRTQNAALIKTMGFFRCVILGGEKWTDTCEDAFRKALAAGKSE